MDENRVDEFLEHHGIKGQRWGIRRTPEQLGHKVSKDLLMMTIKIGGFKNECFG